MNDRGVAVYQHGSWSPTPAEAVGDAAADIRDGQFAINMELCIYKLHTKLTHWAEHLFGFFTKLLRYKWFDPQTSLDLFLGVFLIRHVSSKWNWQFCSGEALFELLLINSAQFRPADVQGVSWCCILLTWAEPWEWRGRTTVFFWYGWYWLNNKVNWIHLTLKIPAVKNTF